MPKHRTLSLETLINTIDWYILQQYFGRLGNRGPQAWDAFNPDAMQFFLDDPKNAEVSGIINDDFQQVNDLGQDSTGLLFRACKKYDIEFGADEMPVKLAMRLFLNYPDAFDFAYSRYVLYNAASRLSIYPLPGVKNLKIGSVQIGAFREGIQRHFSQQAKGEQCIVRPFEDRGETVILIRHGTYIRTIPFWDGDQVSTNSFRPAIEDVLVYDPMGNQLQIRAALEKDRQAYLEYFAVCMAEDPTLAERARKEEVFTLVPLQEGTFSFSGNGPIFQIDLVRLKMKRYGVSNLVLDLKARDIQAAFRHDLGTLTMRGGVLLEARFRFHLRYPPQKPFRVTADIVPPSRITLAQKQGSKGVELYLTEQGVKLH
ncbi:MAG: hypothetical protein HYX96_01550 [Chloroflexi bacterium]|nr:hypothetical protein [Chloroflexota bacterium]